MNGDPELDEVGYWSEIKLDIIRQYATAYTAIMAQQRAIREFIYIDAFAGAGLHISRTTGEYIPGSPLNALNVRPPFSAYHFIDLNGGKTASLRVLSKDHPNVIVHEDDCNAVLLDRVFPLARYEDYRRALCLLDPYGLHLNWDVIQTAGRMKSVEIFLNFPVMDMNMNVLKRNPKRVHADQASRMDAFWGDRSWREAAYVRSPGLFEEMEEKATNDAVAKAFRHRLTAVAGFAHVAPPLPMRNSKGAIVYYLFFASPNPTGHKIVNAIFAKYRNRGVV